VLYSLALLSILPAALIGGTGWIALATGVSLGMVGFFIVSALVIYRIYLVARYPWALDGTSLNAFGSLLRNIGAVAMSIGVLAGVGLLFLKPLTLAILGNAGDSGVGFFVVGVALVLLANLGWMGCVGLEVSRHWGKVGPTDRPEALQFKRPQDRAVLFTLLATAVVGPTLLRWGLASHEAAFAYPTAQEAEFQTACREAGSRFVAKPAQPVRSVAHEHNPQIRRDPASRYELDKTGRIQGTGSLFWTPRIRDYVDFIEERPGGKYGLSKPAKYVRSPRSGQFEGVDELTADIVVMHDVSKPEELDKPVAQQTLVNYTLSVTDRRDGQLLGTMSYWVDMVNRRVCGANIVGAIDEDVFILEAAQIPIVIPAWEQERRSRALVREPHRWEPKK
jgi:hypothetical protein